MDEKETLVVNSLSIYERNCEGNVIIACPLPDRLPGTPKSSALHSYFPHWWCWTWQSPPSTSTRTRSDSDVKHHVLQLRINLDVPLLYLAILTRHALRAVKHLAVPAPAALARNVGVVNGRRDADGGCGAAEEEAHVVGEGVEVVGGGIAA